MDPRLDPDPAKDAILGPSISVPELRQNVPNGYKMTRFVQNAFFGSFPIRFPQRHYTNILKVDSPKLDPDPDPPPDPGPPDPTTAMNFETMKVTLHDRRTTINDDEGRWAPKFATDCRVDLN